jgi:hypothetical protein
MFRSCSCQLICHFITNNTLMTWHPYHLNCYIWPVVYTGFIITAVLIHTTIGVYGAENPSEYFFLK